MNDKLQVSANQERHPTMDNATNPPQPKRKLFPSTLHLLTSIYGLLYLMFFIASFFPSTIGLVSESNNPYDLENLIIKLLFVVFLVGYFISWKREGVAGLIFVLWWVAMWCYGKFICDPPETEGIEMGFPLLILAILFIVSWYNKKRASRAYASSEGTSRKPTDA